MKEELRVELSPDEVSKAIELYLAKNSGLLANDQPLNILFQPNLETGGISAVVLLAF